LSQFLANVARRGAGIAPSVVPARPRARGARPPAAAEVHEPASAAPAPRSEAERDPGTETPSPPPIAAVPRSSAEREPPPALDPPPSADAPEPQRRALRNRPEPASPAPSQPERPEAVAPAASSARTNSPPQHVVAATPHRSIRRAAPQKPEAPAVPAPARVPQPAARPALRHAAAPEPTPDPERPVEVRIGRVEVKAKASGGPQEPARLQPKGFESLALARRYVDRAWR
jgi:hypothetical protein